MKQKKPAVLHNIPLNYVRFLFALESIRKRKREKQRSNGKKKVRGKGEIDVNSKFFFGGGG